MKVRKAEQCDINNNLLSLYIEGFNVHYEKRKDIFSEKTIDELKGNLIEMINNPDENVFVIDDNGKIIGYAATQFKDKATRAIWIDEIVIDINYQNKGYGKILIDEICKYAKQNKCVRVELNCWCFNSNAIEFYNKLGFIQQRIIYEKKIHDR